MIKKIIYKIYYKILIKILAEYTVLYPTKEVLEVTALDLIEYIGK